MDVSFNKPVPELKEDPMPGIGGHSYNRWNCDPSYGRCVIEEVGASTLYIAGRASADLRWRIVKLGSKEFHSSAGVIPFRFKVGDEVLLDGATKGGELGGGPDTGRNRRIIVMMNYVVARVPPGGDDG